MNALTFKDFSWNTRQEGNEFHHHGSLDVGDLIISVVSGWTKEKICSVSHPSALTIFQEVMVFKKGSSPRKACTKLVLPNFEHEGKKAKLVFNALAWVPKGHLDELIRKVSVHPLNNADTTIKEFRSQRAI